jgi:hypothetical protein
MSTIAKVFVVLNLVLAVAFLGAAATFLGYVDSFRTKLTVEETAHANTRKEKDARIASLETEIASLKGQVTTAQGARDTAQTKEQEVRAGYEQLKTQYDALSAAHQRATASLTVAQDTIRALSALKDQLQQDAMTKSEALRAAEDERAAAVKAMNQAQLDLDNTRAQMRELEQKLSACEEARARLQFAYEAAARGGGTGGPGEPQPAQTGKVLAADPRTNIVVISLGSEDGVKAGYRYVVSRGSAYVGTIEVTSTEAKQSAARSIRDLQKSEVRAGDDVMSR